MELQDEKEFTAAAFYRFLDDRQLVGTRCQNCEQLYLPPRAVCPNCHSSRMSWYQFSGQGELAAFTAVYIGPARMNAAGYSRERPYLTGIVRLEEGPMISARLIGLPAEKPEQIKVGTPLQVAFIHEGPADRDESEISTILAFGPAG